jgi:ABC-type sugar transport system ATPase subunit
VLDARGLRKRFKDVQAVDHVDLTVHAGERVGLSGRTARARPRHC